MATHADLTALQGVKEEYEYGFHDDREVVLPAPRVASTTR